MKILTPSTKYRLVDITLIRPLMLFARQARKKWRMQRRTHPQNHGSGKILQRQETRLKFPLTALPIFASLMLRNTARKMVIVLLRKKLIKGALNLTNWIIMKRLGGPKIGNHGKKLMT